MDDGSKYFRRRISPGDIQMDPGKDPVCGVLGIYSVLSWLPLVLQGHCLQSEMFSVCKNSQILEYLAQFFLGTAPNSKSCVTCREIKGTVGNSRSDSLIHISKYFSFAKSAASTGLSVSPPNTSSSSSHTIF